MTTYNAILATETDPDAPLRSSLFKRLVANPIAAFEGDATAVAAGVTLRLQALQRLGAGTSVRCSFSGYGSAPGSTFQPQQAVPFIQSGTVRFSVRHFQTGGSSSEVRIRRVRAGVATTLTTLSTGSGSPGATQTYDADVIAGDYFTFENRNTSINSSTIGEIQIQVGADIALWPATAQVSGIPASTFGLIEGNP